jgi:hypothetical protein
MLNRSYPVALPWRCFVGGPIKRWRTDQSSCVANRSVAMRQSIAREVYRDRSLAEALAGDVDHDRALVAWLIGQSVAGRLVARASPRTGERAALSSGRPPPPDLAREEIRG